MSTRGACGFHFQGKDYVAFNHYDSYPSSLGQQILNFVRNHESAGSWDLVREKVKQLKLINPREETGGREGQLSLYLQQGTMPDQREFLQDGLFCEHAYIVNLDDSILEYYQGFCEKPHDDGRYSKLPSKNNGYQPVRLVASMEFHRCLIGSPWAPPDPVEDLAHVEGA